MFDFTLYTAGIGLVFQPYVLMMLLVGVISGVLIGALPGLTVTMGVAIMVPLTFGMTPQVAFALLLGIYCGGLYGGSMTAVLANIPGTPAAMMTVLDGYPMAKQGRAGEAIGIATLCSFIGGLIGVLILALLAPPIAAIALTFSAQEYFAIAVFGLSIVAYVSPGSTLKGLLAVSVGLLLASIGMDSVRGFPRFTFGSPELLTGLELLPLLIGIFGLAEVFLLLERGFTRVEAIQQMGRVLPPMRDFLKLKFTILRATIVGFFCGVLPGAGASIAAPMSYGLEKRFSHHPELFGTGIPEGIAAPETANNTSSGGAMVPMLTLGIPGDTVTAILIGALLIHGLRPGPFLFKNNPEIVSSIFLLMAMANILFVGVGLLMAKVISKVAGTPPGILLPAITMLCIVGSYAVRNSMFDLGILLVFGVLGYLFHKAGIAPTPFILGFILGPLLETNLRRGLVLSHGSLASFVMRPLSLGFLSGSLLVVFGPYLFSLVIKTVRRGRKFL